MPCKRPSSCAGEPNCEAVGPVLACLRPQWTSCPLSVGEEEAGLPALFPTGALCFVESVLVLTGVGGREPAGSMQRSPVDGLVGEGAVTGL